MEGKLKIEQRIDFKMEKRREQLHVLLYNSMLHSLDQQTRIS